MNADRTVAPIASSTRTLSGTRWVLWAIAAVSLIAAIAVVAMTVWPAPRAGLTPTPAPSAEQLHAQQVVTAHGGSIDVLDTPGGGATFRVRLPLPDDEDDEDFV